MITDSRPHRVGADQIGERSAFFSSVGMGISITKHCRVRPKSALAASGKPAASEER